jgi:phosphoglycolate phosphatase-like HAD superfamily hydrolase
MPTGVKPTAILDLDGPIIDVSFRHYRVYTAGITKLGGTPVDREAFWSAKRHKSPDSEILAQSGLREATVAYKIIKLETIESSSYLIYDQLQPGVPTILRKIANRYRLVLVTLRQSRDRLLQQLVSLRISEFFDSVLSAPAGSKTGWETKRDLIDNAGITVGTGDFFAGDTETDILAGKALGVSTVAVCNGIRTADYLRPLAPDWIIPTLADLPSTNLLK